METKIDFNRSFSPSGLTKAEINICICEISTFIFEVTKLFIDIVIEDDI